jgi:hypothetical protein
MVTRTYVQRRPCHPCCKPIRRGKKKENAPADQYVHLYLGSYRPMCRPVRAKTGLFYLAHIVPALGPGGKIITSVQPAALGKGGRRGFEWLCLFQE